MISKIAYNCCGDSYSTSSILVGTTCGCVYETKLCVSGPSPRLSLRLRLEEATAISGLQLNVIIPSLHHESPLFFVLISTTPPHSRLYYISGDTSRARSVTDTQLLSYHVCNMAGSVIYLHPIKKCLLFHLFVRFLLLFLLTPSCSAPPRTVMRRLSFHFMH